jgi:hypothetical protein
VGIESMEEVLKNPLIFAIMQKEDVKLIKPEEQQKELKQLPKEKL